MIIHIAKWGNSQGIRLPKKILKMAGIQINEEVSLIAEDGKIIIEKTVRHKTLEDRAKAYGDRLGPYEAYDWGEAVGREIW